MVQPGYTLGQGWAELEPVEASSVEMWVDAAPLATDHWDGASQQLQA